MKFSSSWLNELLKAKLTPEEIGNSLTEIGFPLEGMESVGLQSMGVITAKILPVDKHPDADRLRIARVADGEGERIVVCGAPNIAPGQVVPLALPGAVVKGGMEIKVSKIRGVESFGMLCSERELGISDEHGGIFQFDLNTPIGKSIQSVFGEGDIILDIDITPNRPDVLNHVGMARELAAAQSKKLQTPDASWKASLKGDAFDITIKDARLCTRYMGKIIHGVKVGPSPQWLKSRLESCGIRSINNIVDITNYVLLEYGHPLHAFDLSLLKGPEIIVRKANAGEKILALDGKEYTLTTDDLVIADQQKPVAIAGIMGGEGSSVTAATTDILLESAVFESTSVRRTSRRLALRSESSMRFERGTNAHTAEEAAARAAHLILELAGGQAGREKDVYPKKSTPIQITLRKEKIDQTIGMSVTSTNSTKILNALAVKLKPGKGGWNCEIPAHRLDIKEEIDLIEEIARFVGYANVPAEILPFVPGETPASSLMKDDSIIINLLQGLGVSETLTSTFCDKKMADTFGFPGDQQISLSNPLSQEEAILRPALILNLLKAVKFNVNHQYESVHLFERGHRFSSVPNAVREEDVLSVILYGKSQKKFWNAPEKNVDFFDLKNILRLIESETGASLDIRYKSTRPFLHPAESFHIFHENKEIGWGGMIHPSFAIDLDLPAPCAIFEMKWSNRLFRAKNPDFIVPYPFVERDIAVLLSRDVTWARISDVVKKSAGVYLRDLHPFDVYEGKGMDPQMKSLAFRIRLQKSTGTLTDAEIEAAVSSIKTALQTDCSATIR